MEGRENRAARFVDALAFCAPGEEPIVETSILEGSIAEELSGQYGWFTDHFFIPEGYEKPMGNYPDEERMEIWPHDCWHRMAERILERSAAQSDDGGVSR